MFLDSIIREMNESIVQILNRKLFAGCSEIPILIEEAKHMPIYAGQQPIAPDVELTFIYKQRILNVLLENSGLVGARALISDKVFDLVEIFAHYDA